MGCWRRIAAILRSRLGAAAVEDPLSAFDRAEAQHRLLLQKVREGLVEVATSGLELERAVEQARASVPILAARAERAARNDETDLARGFLERKQTVTRDLTTLDGQLAAIRRGEGDLRAVHQRLAMAINQAGTQRAVLLARRAAAISQIDVSEALNGRSGELGELGFAVERAEREANRLRMRAQALASLVTDKTGAPMTLSDAAFEQTLHAAEVGASDDEKRTHLEGNALLEVNPA